MATKKGIHWPHGWDHCGIAAPATERGGDVEGVGCHQCRACCNYSRTREVGTGHTRSSCQHKNERGNSKKVKEGHKDQKLETDSLVECCNDVDTPIDLKSKKKHTHFVVVVLHS